jgi:HAMP domain-containing protein
MAVSLPTDHCRRARRREKVATEVDQGKLSAETDGPCSDNQPLCLKQMQSSIH